MSWEPRPVPDVTAESERYWSAAAEGRLVLPECQDCGLVYFYPRALCPECFSDDVEWREAKGTGEVYSYSTARTVDGWPEDDLPLVVAYVELDEGPRMISNIRANPDDIEVGMPVAVQFVETETEDVGIPVFEPVERGETH